MKKVMNRGSHYRRVKHKAPDFYPDWVNKEKVFADEWEKENKPVRGYGCGHGVLQDLFMRVHEHFYTVRTATHIINKRERMIVATIVQWLGTNVGWAWLESVVDKCGYKLVRKEKVDVQAN